MSKEQYRKARQERQQAAQNDHVIELHRMAKKVRNKWEVVEAMHKQMLELTDKTISEALVLGYEFHKAKSLCTKPQFDQWVKELNVPRASVDRMLRAVGKSQKDSGRKIWEIRKEIMGLNEKGS